MSAAVIGAVLLAAVPAFGQTAAAPGDDCPPVEQGGSAPISAGLPGLAALDAMSALPGEPVTAIATHAEPPDERLVSRLRARGLTVQPLRHLPVTFVAGTLERVRSAADVPGVVDVYPNRVQQFFSRTSTAAIRAQEVWGLGYDGSGMTIAVVDSGIDATHPAFEGRVKRNVKLVGPEYVDMLGVPIPPDGRPDTLVIPFDEGPYSDTDLLGHGTHVAGIAAAADDLERYPEGEDSPVGVAPGADLVGYAVGEPTVIMFLAAFEDILANLDDFPVRVVNNSWGDRFHTFDPGAPINLATKKLAEAGIVVVFAAGNSTEEMTINPWSVAPWVISTAYGGTSRPGTRSSGGLKFDNSSPDVEGQVFDGVRHRRFKGDGLGLYHPTVTAPGDEILSTATVTGPPAGSVQPPGSTATVSGTSMASPHVAGLAALLLHAEPSLTPAQVKKAIEFTAAPLPGWQVWKGGYGFVDALSAVTFVQSDDLQMLDALHEQKTRRLLSRRDHSVALSDHWTFAAAAPATVGGLDTRSFGVMVEEKDAISLVRAAVSFAETAAGVPNSWEWSLQVQDAVGTVLGHSDRSRSAGASFLEISLEGLSSEQFGCWTIQVSGELAVSDLPILYTPSVNVVFTQLQPEVPQDNVLPTDELRLLMTPEEEPLPAASSPEGCTFDAVPTRGGMTDVAAAQCRAALIGYVQTDVFGVQQPAEFLSAPLAEELAVREAETGASLVFHLADAAHAAWSQQGSSLVLTVDAVLPDGEIVAVTEGQFRPAMMIGEEAVRGEYQFATRGVTLPAESRVRLQIRTAGAWNAGMRLLYGGLYDSGLTLPIVVADNGGGGSEGKIKTNAVCQGDAPGRQPPGRPEGWKPPGPPACRSTG